MESGLGAMAEESQEHEGFRARMGHVTLKPRTSWQLGISYPAWSCVVLWGAPGENRVGGLFMQWSTTQQ
jgi:hypothetical protein